MRGFNSKKTQSNEQRVAEFLQGKRPIQISSLSSNSEKPKNMTPEEQLKYLKQKLSDKFLEFQNKQKLLKIEVFKNSKLKEEIQNVDNEFYEAKLRITLDLIEKNKDNKDSPLFYNQNGLSPMEITLVEEKRFQAQGMTESYVCMICFQDIQNNQTVIYLPCEHNFHKDCVIQHLLASKFCPSCSQPINLVEHNKKKLSKEKKGSNITFF